MSQVTLPSVDLSQARKVFQNWKSADLCSGLGGFSIAAKMLGMNPVVSIDNWSLGAQTYAHNFPDATSYTNNICKSPDRRELVRTSRKEDVDIVFAGPPCQGFTQVRNGQRTSNDANIAVTHGVKRALKEIQPPYFVIENVPLLLNHHDGNFAKHLFQNLRALAPEGYNVTHQVYNASSLGVPQQRRRLLILGSRRDYEELRLQELPDYQYQFSTARRNQASSDEWPNIKKILDDKDDARMVTAKQAIGDLPKLESGTSPVEPAYNFKPNPYQALMRGVETAPTLVATPRMLLKTKQRLARIPPGQCLHDIPAKDRGDLKRKFFSAYRRLHPDLPSTTLFTKIDCAYHYEQLRALSVREYARLQSIPDAYQFPVANRNAYAMIGNAVPPLMVANALALAARPS